MIQKIYHKKDIAKDLEKGKLYNEHKEKLKISYPLKENYESVIPLNIYQTWHTKKLPEKMFKTIKLIKNLNPRFKYQLFDDNDCREFIKNNFESDVLHSFDSLIPGAYKADLWRYCVLYKNGGIYLDIKYKPLNNFRFITMTEKEHFVLDSDATGVYNALMVCKPGNEVLLKAINQIVKNVRNKYYGTNFLEPTGPKLLQTFFSSEEKNNFDMKHYEILNHNSKVILYNNYIIFMSYDGHINDRIKYSKTKHYSDLWKERNIYK
jgi:mannosyltransferase OCH1-like enzyme